MITNQGTLKCDAGRLGLKDNGGDGCYYFDESWLDSGNIDLHRDGGDVTILPSLSRTAPK